MQSRRSRITRINREAAMTKERPILFSAPMVRAILEGQKTVTRRVIKTQPGKVSAAGLPKFFEHGDTGRRIIPKCPYGKPGDRLWVRETWGYWDDGCGTAEESTSVIYKADHERPEPKRWRPSIHMFRADSRIDLEITAVRAERLQDITQEHAEAELGGFNPYGRGQGVPACQRFARLWMDINGASSWEENPWVWVVEFKRIQESR